jgi:hypothetical protein
MLAHDHMDAVSVAFANALFAEFPDWEALAKTVTDERNGTSYVELSVGQDGTDRALYLRTADNEITIGFDRWHTHIGPFLGIDVADSVAQAMTIIRDFINEVTVVTVSYRDGAWIESGLGYRTAPKALQPQSITKVFSWRRTYATTIETP